MTDFIAMTVSLVVYRIVSILVGALVVFLGYKLFLFGVYEKAGELQAVWGAKKLILKQALPGTLFALFVAGIISLALWRGIDLQRVHEIAAKHTESSPIVAHRIQTPASASASSPRHLPPNDKKQSQTLPLRRNISEVRPIIEKSLKGDAVTDEERKKVQQWFGQEELYSDSIHGVAQENRPIITCVDKDGNIFPCTIG